MPQREQPVDAVCTLGRLATRVAVTERYTKVDWAQSIQRRLDKTGISAMVDQCLNRRPPVREALRREVDAWQERSHAGELAIHDHRRADQTEITLPINIKAIAC